MSARLTIDVCGPVVLTINARYLKKFRSRKAVALLIYLACADSTQPREKVADLLWDASSTKQSLSNLRTVLSMLRAQIPNHIFSSQNQIGISPESSITVDYVMLCEQLAKIPRVLDADTACQLEKTLKLYRGEFLEDFLLRDTPRFTRWVRRKRQWLHSNVIDAYDRLANYQLVNQEFSAGINTTQRWLQHDPVDEAAYALLIEMLLKSGKQYAALKQYSICCELLRDELDVEPAPEIQKMISQLGVRGMNGAT